MHCWLRRAFMVRLGGESATEDIRIPPPPKRKASEEVHDLKPSPAFSHPVTEPITSEVNNTNPPTATKCALSSRIASLGLSAARKFFRDFPSISNTAKPHVTCIVYFRIRNLLRTSLSPLLHVTEQTVPYINRSKSFASAPLHRLRLREDDNLPWQPTHPSSY